MLTIEIAGHTFLHRNAPDLNAKVRELVADLRDKASNIEKHALALRNQERILLRFLGEGKVIKPVRTVGTLKVTALAQEVSQHA